MRWAILLLFFRALTPSIASCQATPGFPFDLANPDRTIKLPDKLNEISGLGWVESGTIASVQDEKGNLYLIDLNDESADKIYEYEEKGDYEAVEIVEKTAWALESNGNLHAVYDFRDSKHYHKKFKDGLPSGAEAEGLAWDPAEKRLLIALKEGEKLDHKRAVFSFDPQSGSFSDHARFVIDEKDLAKWLHGKGMRRGDDAGDINFRPSGIAVHPLSGELYLISSTARLLLVLGTDGSFLHAAELDRDVHRQPEGICFEPDGTMWISNEGRKKSSKLLKFDYRP